MVMATKESLIDHSLKNKHVLETPVENCLYKPFQLVDINTTLSKVFHIFDWDHYFLVFQNHSENKEAHYLKTKI